MKYGKSFIDGSHQVVGISTKKGVATYFKFESGKTPYDEKIPVIIDKPSFIYPISKDEAQRIIAPLLRFEERVKIVIDSIENKKKDYKGLRSPPPSRILNVGDSAVVGALSDAKIEYISADAEFYVVSYNNSKTKNPDYDREISCFPWVDVFAHNNSEQIALDTPALWGAFSTSCIEGLISKLDWGWVTDQTDYQRDYVWTEEDREQFYDSLFSGVDIGRFVIIDYEYPRESELLDGKQRVNALRDLFESRVKYKGKYWHELSVRDRYIIENRNISLAQVRGEKLKKSDIYQYFLMLNKGGVPQSEDHLKSVKTLYENALREENYTPKSIKP